MRWGAPSAFISPCHHSSRPCVATGLKRQPEVNSARGRWPEGNLLFVLHRVGFTMTADVTACPVRSYRTVSPLQRPVNGALRFVFCGTFPRVTPGRRYRSPSLEMPGLYLSRFNPPAMTSPTSRDSPQSSMGCGAYIKTKDATRKEHRSFSRGVSCFLRTAHPKGRALIAHSAALYIGSSPKASSQK